MKKLIAIGIAIMLVLSISALSHADILATTKDITVDLSVSGSFGMEIWDNEFVQDMGSVAPGAGATGDIHIYATSNHGRVWTISVASAGLVGPETLPFKLSSYDGGGNPDPLENTASLVTNLVLTGSAQPIYSAGASEFTCVGLIINGIFSMQTYNGTEPESGGVPTQEGDYNGTIQLTMTD